MTLAEQAEQAAQELNNNRVGTPEFITGHLKAMRVLNECAAALREREGAQQAGQVPDGYKLVPVEPTYGMSSAWREAASLAMSTFRQRYKAMLAAAPEAPAQPEQAAQGKGEREAFEAWIFDTQKRQPTTWAKECAKYNMPTPDNKVGHYYFREDQLLWQAWQARAALSAAPQRKPMEWTCPKCGIERAGPLIACAQQDCPPMPAVHGITGEGA